MDIYKQKEIIVFDLDGTLSKSRKDIGGEMSSLLCELLEIKKVAIISGGTFKQIQKAVVSKLECSEKLFKNLFLFPTCAASFYKYIDGKWEEKYKQELDEKIRMKIINAFKESLNEAGYIKPNKIYGDIIEDRKTQITFSGLGQKAPLEKKKVWDPKGVLRKKIIKSFNKKIDGFDANVGGTTSIDINKKGIDKAYGIRQIEKTLNIPIKNMVFVGDALYEGGNDEAVIRTGIDTISVETPEDTKKIIRDIID